MTHPSASLPAVDGRPEYVEEALRSADWVEKATRVARGRGSQPVVGAPPITGGPAEDRSVSYPLHLVSSMHHRKAEMVARADAFVALPGGFGTFDELFEVLTWSQLGLHHKPCALLDVDGYFEPLCAFLDHATVEGLLRHEHRAMLFVERDPERLLDRLAGAPSLLENPAR